MGTPYLSEIRIVSFGYAPKGWALCNGQVLPINQNQALFSLMGTTYGGNGVSNFSLPNLQGRVPMHFGNGFAEGLAGGEASHTLTLSEIPSHNHTYNATSDPATPGVLTNGTLATPAASVGNVYASGPAATAISPAAVAVPGGAGQPHYNMQPFAILNFIIAMQGIFPSQN